MVERKLKDGKNPKRVAAGKKAWRKAHRGGGKVTKRRGSVSKGYHRAKATLGRTIKAVVILSPPVIVAYVAQKEYGGTIGERIINFINEFQGCYTGVQLSGRNATFHAERLALGWGPPLIIGGVSYGLRAVHASGNNPFTVVSRM